MQIFVDAKAAPGGSGSKERPYQRISDAAETARPGDEVLVAPGIYRENVDPKHAGTPDARIVYRSVQPLAAVITGAEVLDRWTPVEGYKNVWTSRVGNGVFGSYNPYTTLVSGDWFIASHIAHTGDVFLNGKSMYEAADLAGVYEPKVYKPSWDREFSVYTWHADQDPETNETVFTANFQGKNPNEENVEISVRENCFYPQKEGVGYITLSGFTVCKAATQWAPPTAYQEGMIGPHWSKGWIIEDCEIYESKCSGISLGKYLQKDNDNKWLHTKYKDGTQTERECILEAQRDGWSKETVGSHIIRRCNIHDCGQTGIVGHLGGVFSVIENNHIHHINNKQNLAGAEIGGIKMHAAIDVIIRGNHIHNCTRGLWLDWQAQGTRVTRNLFHDNTLPAMPENPEPDEMAGAAEDIFVEVSHGPTLIDNNLLLSDCAFKAATQGFALVHNLIAGGITAVGIGTDNGAKTLDSPRYTPYHVPHRTEVAGFMTFLHGDDRFYNNIFVQKPMRAALKARMEYTEAHPNCWDDNNIKAGTFKFNGYPTFEEWNRMFEGYCGMGSEPSDRYYSHLPVWASGNVYLNGAEPWEKEKNLLADSSGKVTIAVETKKEADGTEGWYLSTNLYEVLEKLAGAGKKLPDTSVISTETLGMAFEPEEKYENPDGTEIIFNTDFFGRHRCLSPLPGPFADGKEAGEKLA
ncbi:MAG: right-handed parallel beta-helix repeat-containing protein [Lachnospiraceae bacterium]|jgi:hypothetical protein